VTDPFKLLFKILFRLQQLNSLIDFAEGQDNLDLVLSLLRYFIVGQSPFEVFQCYLLQSKCVLLVRKISDLLMSVAQLLELKCLEVYCLVY
jgi:hypothetical protein